MRLQISLSCRTVHQVKCSMVVPCKAKQRGSQHTRIHACMHMIVLQMSELILSHNMHKDVLCSVCGSVVDKQQACQLSCQVNVDLIQQPMI